MKLRHEAHYRSNCNLSDESIFDSTTRARENLASSPPRPDDLSIISSLTADRRARGGSSGSEKGKRGGGGSAASDLVRDRPLDARGSNRFARNASVLRINRSFWDKANRRGEGRMP